MYMYLCYVFSNCPSLKRIDMEGMWYAKFMWDHDRSLARRVPSTRADRLTNPADWCTLVGPYISHICGLWRRKYFTDNGARVIPLVGATDIRLPYVFRGVERHYDAAIQEDIYRCHPEHPQFRRQWNFNTESIPWDKVRRYARAHFMDIINHYHAGVFPWDDLANQCKQRRSTRQSEPPSPGDSIQIQEDP